jgi:hypothetical protein
VVPVAILRDAVLRTAPQDEVVKKFTSYQGDGLSLTAGKNEKKARALPGPSQFDANVD